jgi:hypothetical protein
MRHQRLDLGDNDADPYDSMRPILSVWPDDDDNPRGVVLSVGPKHGSQQRYVELTPDEARTLGLYLMEAATAAERKEQVK